MNEQEAIIIIEKERDKLCDTLNALPTNAQKNAVELKEKIYAQAMAVIALEKQISLERIVEKLENEVEKAMRISEKAAELGKDYERHMLYHGGKGNAFEEAIEIVKEEGGIND